MLYECVCEEERVSEKEREREEGKECLKSFTTEAVLSVPIRAGEETDHTSHLRVFTSWISAARRAQLRLSRPVRKCHTYRSAASETDHLCDILFVGFISKEPPDSF